MQHFGISNFRLWPGRQRTVCISIPKISTKFFSSPNRPDRLWGPTSLPLRGNRTVFIAASPSSAEVTNAWSCISIFAYAFKACVKNNFIFIVGSFSVLLRRVFVILPRFLNCTGYVEWMDGCEWTGKDVKGSGCEVLQSCRTSICLDRVRNYTKKSQLG
jgi:hypothetical protein